MSFDEWWEKYKVEDKWWINEPRHVIAKDAWDAAKTEAVKDINEVLDRLREGKYNA
jgi:hypothetical protein